ARGPASGAARPTSCSPGRSPGPSCRRCTRPATSTRCRAAPGPPGSTSKASASCIWRPRPPALSAVLAAGVGGEGLGIVYLEASATGLPVVAGDSGGAPDAVLEGETGYVVPGRDVAAIAGRIADLLGDPDRARAMGAAGRSWVEREWRWEKQAARLEALLHMRD